NMMEIKEEKGVKENSHCPLLVTFLQAREDPVKFPLRWCFSVPFRCLEQLVFRGVEVCFLNAIQ
ncbi:hypothetical protein STEG23_002670, partial [Scotinomys teguina]